MATAVFVASITTTVTIIYYLSVLSSGTAVNSIATVGKMDRGIFAVILPFGTSLFPLRCDRIEMLATRPQPPAPIDLGQFDWLRSRLNLLNG